LRLFVHAQHDRVLRWLEIEADYIGGLRNQIQVGGEFECLTASELDAMFPPYSGDGSVLDLQVLGE
jgi:hypothetical protein